MDHIPASPSYVTWLLGQSLAVVVLVLWVLTLLRTARNMDRHLKRSSEINQQLASRNAELSDSLVELVQSTSRERADSRESDLRTTLDSLESALLNKRRG